MMFWSLVLPIASVMWLLETSFLAMSALRAVTMSLTSETVAIFTVTDTVAGTVIDTFMTLGVMRVEGAKGDYGVVIGGSMTSLAVFVGVTVSVSNIATGLATSF